MASHSHPNLLWLCPLALVASGCGSGGSSPAATAPGVAQPPPSGFASFESTPTRPIALSADGERLFVAHSVRGQLSVFSLADPARPVLLDELPVGLEPVAVAERVPGEVWVANQLSDTVSVVDVTTGRTLATLAAGDQPSDIAFAQGRAFVTAATEDRVLVFDGTTRALVGAVAIPAEEPRALVADPDGQRVWVLARRSGNGTTLLPADLAPPQPPPTNPDLPAPPETGLIVRADDPQWSAAFPYSLPDEDLFAIHAGTLGIVDRVAQVGTTNYALVPDAPTGRVFVAATQARNTIRFEPELRARAVEHRIVAVDGAFGTVQTIVDLNPEVETEFLPDLDGLATALAEPTGLALDPGTRELFVAAQGSDRIGVLDADSGQVLRRIELGEPGDGTRQRRGPRALVLHPSEPQLYCYNRLSETLSVVDRDAGQVLVELPIGSHDPMPAALREGRKFLYDARLSGNGTQSCAVCHVDGETDGLAWDLGDPGGELFEVPFELQSPPAGAALPFDFPDLHPMKGPLVTQSLRGLGTPLHWRGDKLTFEDFNGAYDSLLGGSPLSDEDMGALADWARSVLHPPNPNQPLDRSLSSTPFEASPALGAALFLDTPVAGKSCVDCHSLPATTSGLIVKLPLASFPPSRVAPLLDYYRKDGFDPDHDGPLAVGFGRFGDGRVGDLVELSEDLPVFAPEAGGSSHVDAYLRQLDTGTPPAVGVQVDLGPGSVGDPAAAALRWLLIGRAELEELELVAHGLLGGERRALLYDATAQVWRPDRSDSAPLSTAAFEVSAEIGAASMTWTAVPFGGGALASIDRDEDGRLDGDLAAVPYGPATPTDCTEHPRLAAPVLPRIGQELFTVRVEGVAPNSAGVLRVGQQAVELPLGTLTLLVSPGAMTVPLVADGYGVAAAALPIPDDETWIGRELRFQALWAAPCDGGLAASAGLAAIVAP